jgi:hypothetical protein
MEFWQVPCWYCGYEIFTVGLDRIDNDKGYEAGQLRSSCTRCNQARNNLTTEKFLEMCRRIAAKHPDEASADAPQSEAPQPHRPS